MDEMLRKAWEIATESGITADEWDHWRDFFAASTLWPIAKKDKIIGFLMLHGYPEERIMIHIIVKKEWHVKWVTKDIVRAFRGWDPGVDVVALVKDIDKAARLVGFKPTDEVDGEYRLWVKYSKIKKEQTKCHQQSQ